MQIAVRVNISGYTDMGVTGTNTTSSSELGCKIVQITGTA